MSVGPLGRAAVAFGLLLSVGSVLAGACTPEVLVVVAPMMPPPPDASTDALDAADAGLRDAPVGDGDARLPSPLPGSRNRTLRDAATTEACLAECKDALSGTLEGEEGQGRSRKTCESVCAEVQK